MGAEFQVESLEEMCDLMCNNKVPTPKLEPLSIEETIRQLKKCKSFHNGSYGEALTIAIKALEQETVLDKIRTEIESLKEGISSYHNDRPWIFKDEVMAIIDKYTAERKG